MYKSSSSKIQPSAMVEISQAVVKPDTEIRKLSGRFINGLIQILEPNKDWEKLMSEIRQDCFNLNDKSYKYTDNDIKMIGAAASRASNQNQLIYCTEIFLDEWATSGRKRPTVQLLYDYLRKIGLWKAADYIGTNFLNLPEIEPPQGPSNVEIDINDITLRIQEPVDHSKNIYDSHHHRSTAKCGEYILSNIEEYDEVSERCATVVEKTKMEIKPSIDPEILSNFINQIDDRVEQIPYEVLKAATQNFDENCKVGKGAFASVYLGKLNDVNRAIKVLKNSATEHFERELTILSSNIRHSRLLSPIAVSIDKVPCLVYPYMSHGSLEDRLALKLEDLLPLGWQKRIMIARHIIEGLRYLHTRPQPIVHRDIKTSNILLDAVDVAKIGDFGLVRKKKAFLTSRLTTVEGTDAYMAPEAYRFQSTTKLDVYSYGMVLLELLTGLPIFDEEKGHLKDYVEEELEDEDNDIIRLLDKKAGKWPNEIANELYVIANNCLEYEPRKRYDSEDVERILNNLIGKIIVSR